MLTNRIYKLGTRWTSNRLGYEYTLFDDGVQLSLVENKKKKSSSTKSKSTESKPEGGQRKKKRKVDAEDDDDEDVGGGGGGISREGIRLPSRQWANWIIYLTLRDTLILAKVRKGRLLLLRLHHA
jgi:hypothetical protein